MKKNLITPNSQILIITLLILAVLVPKQYSQECIFVALFLWLVFKLGIWLYKLKGIPKSKYHLKFQFRHSKENDNSQKSISSTPLEKEEKTNSQITLFTFNDDEVETIFLHLSLRITEKLKSAYPKVVWQWTEKPSLHTLLSGSTIRIIVENMNNFTHADIIFDRYGRIRVEPMTIGIFSPITNSEKGEEKISDSNVVDVKSWYELIGQRTLEAQITELNASGHNKLTIKENGDIVINRNKKEVLVSSLESFPNKNYWNEFISILNENELHAKISGNSLQVSWL